MPSYSTDRRGALKILGSIGASCVGPVAGDELYGRTADEAATPVKPSFFTAADFSTISRVAELILPGAVAAGVPSYIDWVVSRNGAQQALLSDGLRWLDGTGELSVVLQALCEEADAGRTQGRMVQWFVLVKSLTADGFYTSRAGLVEDLGYQGNSMMASFPVCLHEH
jgi:hypothetical protein